MSDLRVVATIAAKPGAESDVAQALSKLAAASREEPGCVAYEVFESAAVPGTFVTVETWESKDALDAHMGSPALGETMAAQADNLGEIAIHPLNPI